MAGVRGRYGHGVITNLPVGAIHYPWNGGNYWNVGFGWWAACWVGDNVCYEWAYPPVGYYYPSLPAEYETTVINNTTYYESDGVYYVEGAKEGQPGYTVAEAPVTPETTQPEGGVEGVNPFDILKGMCDHLAGLERFRVVAKTVVDQVGEDGSTAQLSLKRATCLQRPDRIAVDVTGDVGVKRFVYDGKNASLYDAAKSTAISAEMPGTIEAALDTLATEHKVVLPLADLMYKDLYDRAMARITAGQYLGLPTVNGGRCHHLGFTTDNAEWELWIDVASKLPRRASVSYLEGSVRVRQSADLAEWNEAPTFNNLTFEFKPPASAMGIEISKVNP